MTSSAGFDLTSESMVHLTLADIKDDCRAQKDLCKTLSTIKKENSAKNELHETLSSIRKASIARRKKNEETAKATPVAPMTQDNQPRRFRQTARMSVHPRWWGRDLSARTVERLSSFWVTGEFDDGPNR